MKETPPTVPKWRCILALVAIAAVVTAFILWQLDGAWEYGSMPTKGLFRTFLFAMGGVVCLIIPVFLVKKEYRKP